MLLRVASSSLFAENNSRNTLEDALTLAHTDPTEGWRGRRGGARFHQAAKHAVECVGAGRRCVDITGLDIYRLNSALVAQGRTSRQIAEHLHAFDRVLYFAERERWISARPQHPQLGVGGFVFTPEHERKVLDFLSAGKQRDIADMFVLGIDGGFSLAELLALRGEAVDESTRSVTLRGDGRGTAGNRELECASVLARGVEVLARRKAVYGDGPLFPSVTSEQVARQFKGIRAMLGVPGKAAIGFPAMLSTYMARAVVCGGGGEELADSVPYTPPQIPARIVRAADSTAANQRKDLDLAVSSEPQRKGAPAGRVERKVARWLLPRPTFACSIEDERLALAFIRRAGRADVADVLALLLDGALQPNDICSVEGAEVDAVSGALWKPTRWRLMPLGVRSLEVLTRRKALYGEGPLFPELDQRKCAAAVRNVRRILAQLQARSVRIVPSAPAMRDGDNTRQSSPMALIAGMLLSGSENNPHAAAWFLLGAMAALGIDA